MRADAVTCDPLRPYDRRHDWNVTDLREQRFGCELVRCSRCMTRAWARLVGRYIPRVQLVLVSDVDK